MGKQILKRRAVKEATLIRYLLGNLSERKKRELEELYFADDDVYEDLQVAERELIDRYVYGKLSRAELKRFESYFLVADSRRQKTRLAMELKQRFSTSTDRPAPFRYSEWVRAILARPVIAALCFILAVGLGGAIWWIAISQSDVSKGMAVLKKAYQNERPLEARISELNYAPWSINRGGETEDEKRYKNLAENLLLTAVTENPAPESHHAAGRLYLTNKQFDEAINEFEEALKTSAANAQLHSDLGAALLEKTKMERSSEETGDSVEGFAKSLEHLNKALDLDSSLREALFNRALLRQLAFPLREAKQDWQKYLETDSDSPWAAEARHNLKIIEDQINSESRSKEEIIEELVNAYKSKDSERVWRLFCRDREGVAKRLISEYLQASLPGVRADDWLQTLAYVGDLDIQKTGDHYAADLAKFYRSASPAQIGTAVRARELMALARERYIVSKYEEAIELYSNAGQMFSHIGDASEAELSKYWLAFSYLETTKTEQSRSILELLCEACKKSGYRWLLARSLYGLSATQFNFNSYSNAINYGLQSLALADEISDQPGILNARSSLIEYYRFLGNYRECLNQIWQSLPLLQSGLLGQIQTWRHCSIIASAFNSFDLYDAAIDYQQEALRIAEEVGDVSMLSVSNAHLGIIYEKLRNHDGASGRVQLAYEIAEQHSADSAGREMMAYSSLQIGNLYRGRKDFSKALESYNRCIELYTSLDFPTFLYQAYKGRLYCYVAQRDDALAEEEFDRALALVNKYRTKIFEQDNRNNFFDVEQNLYDMAIDFEFSRMGRKQKAFEYSEESKARSLLDSIKTSTKVINKNGEIDLRFQSVSQPLTLDEIQKRIPQHARILQYAMLEDKLLIWVISKTTISPVEVNVGQKELTEAVLSYLSLLKSYKTDKEDVTSKAKYLFETLIKPVEAALDNDKELYLVPDKILNRVPWDALVSPATDKFLLEDYLVVLCPSASLFALCTELSVKKGGAKSEKLLSVGNPLIDHNTSTSLPDLTDAAREAETIAGYYGSPPVFTKGNARESIIRSELQNADIAHFALHCVVNERSTMRSSLVLAKEKAEVGDHARDGVLESHEIYGMDLPLLRVAVLSACQSGVERYYRGEGMIGMARSFIAARVPMVVSTLWSVDSAATADLMIRFHEYRKRESKSTAEALRLAKKDMLINWTQRFREPYYWAAFVAIGGHADF